MLVTIVSREFGHEVSYLSVEYIHLYIGEEIEFSYNGETVKSIIDEVSIRFDKKNKKYEIEFTLMYKDKPIKISSKNNIKIWR